MKKLLIPLLTCCLLSVAISGCGSAAPNTTDNNTGSGSDIVAPDTNGDSDSFVNPGDSLGGGGTATYQPSATDTYSDVEKAAIATVKDIDGTGTSIPEGATHITKKATISEAGDYYIDSEISGKITISADGVNLYLNGATITNDKKVIDSDCSLTITLIGENTITNTSVADDKNAIDCAGDLKIVGGGSLSVTSVKNAIKANSISIIGGTVTVDAQKDGLHAEISSYDDLTQAPTFSYDDGGFVYLDGATVNVTSADDGIQADTFVYIKGDSKVNVKAGGGAPNRISETSSDNASGKGIKAGNIDWGADDTEMDGDYLILIEGGEITVNSNDDAIHSNSRIVVSGGTLSLTSGDDGVHADNFLGVSGGEITVANCYEGLEAAKVEISGGKINVTSVDDGINAADGTATRVNVANNNCHIIISGGEVNVSAEGDGLDSNGSMLISGGTVYVMGPTSGNNAALDADGSIVVNGGYLFAAGPLGMVETPASNSAQYVVSYARNSAISANTIITLADSDGEIMSYTVTKSCQSIIISCPELTKGSSYTLYGGDSTLSTFTVNSTITTVGSSSSINSPNTRPNFNIGGHRP